MMPAVMGTVAAFIKRKIGLIFLAFLAIAVLVFVGKNTIFKASPKPTYQSAKVEKGTIIASVTASGQILSANTLTITTNASGVVKEVYIKDGDWVVAGQKLADIELDTAGLQKEVQAWASYVGAQSSLASANASYYSLQSSMFSKWKAYTDLATNSTYQNADGSPNTTNRALPQFAITQDDWLYAEAQYKNQEKAVTQAQASLQSAWISYQLASSYVTAPMAGTIGNITFMKGLVVNGGSTSSTSTSSTGQTMAVIENDNAPIASFNISEVDVSKVQPGQKVTITLDSISGKTFTGKVATVDRIGAVSSNVTNYPVLVQLDTKSSDILPNMTANANIIISTKDNVLMVPTSAVTSQNGEQSVRILKNGQVQQAVVEVGLVSDTHYEIVSGVSEGDEVITGTTSATTSTSSPFSRTGGIGGGGAFRVGNVGGGGR